MVRIEQFIPDHRGYEGRPPKTRAAIARSFVAKMVYNMTTTRALWERLHSDKNLRRICGWENSRQIPSEATFSRAMAEFAETQLPQRVHEALINKIYRETDTIVVHNSRDSTAIEAREKPLRKNSESLTEILTSASVHDSQVAIPLAKMTAKRVVNLYDLMDADYDVPGILAHSRSLEHVPLVDKNPRRDKALAE